jgi:hypothetical protein
VNLHQEAVRESFYTCPSISILGRGFRLLRRFILNVLLVSLLANTMVLALRIQTLKADSSTVTVPGTAGGPLDSWVDTGIWLAGGQNDRLTASGWVSWDAGYSASGPNGDPNWHQGFTNPTLPGAPVGALIGDVGGRLMFFVGSGPTIVTGEGELYLAVNDNIGAYWNNVGSFTVTIEYSVTPTMIFDVSVSPVFGSIPQGGSAQTNITVNLVSGDLAPVTLYVTGNTAGITAALSQSYGYPSFSSVLSLETTNATQAGKYVIDIAASGGGMTKRASYTLTVGSPTGPILRASLSSDVLTLIQGHTGSTVLTIMNVGDQPLTWSLSCNATSWTSFAKLSGLLNPQGKDDVQVCLNNARALGFGSYISRITIQGSQASGSFATQQDGATSVGVKSSSLPSDQKDIKCNVVGSSDSGSGNSGNMINIESGLINAGDGSYAFTMAISGSNAYLLFDDNQIFTTLLPNVINQLNNAGMNVPTTGDASMVSIAKRGMLNSLAYEIMTDALTIEGSGIGIATSYVILGTTGLALSTAKIVADRQIPGLKGLMKTVVDDVADAYSTYDESIFTTRGTWYHGCYFGYDGDPYSPTYVVGRNEELLIVVKGLSPPSGDVTLKICGTNAKRPIGQSWTLSAGDEQLGPSNQIGAFLEVYSGSFFMQIEIKKDWWFHSYNLWGIDITTPIVGEYDVSSTVQGDPLTPFLKISATYAIINETQFNSSSSALLTNIFVPVANSTDFPGSSVSIFVPALLGSSNESSFVLTLNDTLIPYNLKYIPDLGYGINATLMNGGELALSIPQVSPTIAITPSYMGSLIVCGNGFSPNESVILQYFNGSDWISFSNESAVHASESGVFEFSTATPAISFSSLVVMAVGQGGECALATGTIGYCAEAFVCFDPHVAYLSSHWVTAYIEFSDGNNISDIDLESVMLNGTVPDGFEPYPLIIGDFNNNSIPDLMVEFNTTEVAQYIHSRGTVYGNVTLSVVGYLYDGTMFGGNMTIALRIPGDVNSDGKVNLIDVFSVALAYGSYPGYRTWNPNCDINNDGKINLIDYFVTALNYGKTYP